MSEWTPGQTSINIRGAATDGQGRDFKSQVLVLINGHRAGTANLSKMSLADIDRIEIVRGPSSVIYGSQNMGGVINIILKTGRTAPGTFVEGSGGSWGLEQGKAQNGGVYKGFDWYAGAYGGKRDDFQIGGGSDASSTPPGRGIRGHRRSAIRSTRTIGSISTSARDGVFDVGFRGSSANIFAFDNRYNSSFDVSLHGEDARRAAQLVLPGLRRQRRRRPQQSLAARARLIAPRTLARPQQAQSRHRRHAPAASRTISGAATSCCSGCDCGAQLAALRPLTRRPQQRDRAADSRRTDNNQTESVYAFYLEDAQTLLRRPADACAAACARPTATRRSIRPRSRRRLLSGQQATTRRPPTRSARRTRRH